MLGVLMNPYFQVAGVVILVALVILIISILKKKLNINRILILLALLFVGGTAVFLNFTASAKKVQPAYDQLVADRYFAACYAEIGDFDKAYKLLGDSATDHEQPGDILNLARLSVMRDNYLYAQLFYAKYMSENPGDNEAVNEAGIASGLSGNSYNESNNGAIANMLDRAGMSYEDAGFVSYSPTATNKVDDISAYKVTLLEKMVKSCEEYLKGREDKNDIKKCAESIVIVDRAYENYRTGRDYMSEELSDAVSRLNKVVRAGGMLAQNTTVRNAALIANTLAGDAEAVCRNINEYATVDELAVAIELRTKGYVTDKAFKALPEKPESEKLTEVYNQCQEIKNNKIKGLGKEKEAYYKSLISLIKDSNKNYVVKTLLSLLTSKSLEIEESARSQMYMQLAKGYQYANMGEQVSSYLDLALTNAANASDKEYAQAMGLLVDYIAGKSLSYSELDRCIEQAMNHVISVPMSLFVRDNTAAVNGMLIYVNDEEIIDPGKSFESIIKNEVTQKRATINIGRIDTSAFPKLSTKISFGDAAGITIDNIKNNIEITDCEFPIVDYEVSERQASGTRVILMCDNSGSMSNDIDNLRDAVKSFADGMQEGEEVAVVGFTSGVTFRSDFLTSKEEVKAYADKMIASGGTNIYGLLANVTQLFGENQGSNNVLIVMTDGLDNYGHTDSEIRRGISEIVGNYGCAIYTIGLGDGTDSNYLQNIANYGNGQFLHVSQSSDLESFYNFVHSQVANQYVITFEAVDQSLVNRKLNVTLNNVIGTADKKYSLKDDADSSYEDYVADRYNPLDPDGLQVYGFGNTYFYQSGKDTTLTMYGENFTKFTDYKVRLTSNTRNVTLAVTVKSDTEMEVIVPGTIATGSYELKVSGKNKAEDKNASATVASALTVGTAPELSSFKFGDYVFTCENITKNSDEVILSDNVTLNGWLHFKGDIKLTGNYDGTVSQYVTLTDNSGSEVTYSRQTAKGLTKILAAKGTPISIPSLGSFRIYSESYNSGSYDSFKVDSRVINSPIYVKGFAYIKGTTALYPDMFYTEAFFSELSIDYLDAIFKNLPKELWNTAFTGSFALTNTQICMNASLELSYNKSNDKKKSFQLGTVDLRIDKFKADINTIKGEYGLEFEVGFSDFEVGDISIGGFGLSVTAVNGDYSPIALDSVELSVSGSTKVMILQTPVPMYLSGLSFGVSGLSKVHSKQDILGCTFAGGFKLESSDIISKVPKKVKNLFKMNELKLFEVPDAKLSVTLQNFNINFSASLEFLGMKIGECKINLGNFNYESTVLNIDCEEKGASVQLWAGIQKDWANLSIDASGEVDITLGYPASVLSLKGNLSYDINWFIFSWGKDVYADFGMGLLWNEDNQEIQFILKVYYQKSNGDYDGFRIDVSPTMGNQKHNY